MKSQTSYYRYWGKAKDLDWHCLPYHCLDVAAVGQVLLEQHAPMRHRLEQLTGFTSADLKRWIVFLLIFHDVGKFSVTFQNARPDLLMQLQNRTSAKTSGHDGRHDTVGFRLWVELLAKQLQHRGLLTLDSGRFTTPQSQAINSCMAAMTGHHGTPPRSQNNVALLQSFETTDEQAAISFFQDICDVFLQDAQPFPIHDSEPAKQLQFASWWLSGFAVLGELHIA